MSLGGLLLGLLNLAFVIAILVLIGYIILWLMNMLGFPIPGQVQKIYMVIVALIALYMIVALLLGVGPHFRIFSSTGHPLYPCAA
jgi:hypothetical protein